MRHAVVLHQFPQPARRRHRHLRLRVEQAFLLVDRKAAHQVDDADALGGDRPEVASDLRKESVWWGLNGCGTGPPMRTSPSEYVLLRTLLPGERDCSRTWEASSRVGAMMSA